MGARERQMWERRAREWEMEQDERRFELLDSDDDDDDPRARRGALAEARYYGDLAYSDDYDELSQEYEQGHDMQVAMRNREDELAERAMRRIRRARMKGESSIDLSREELDALEKRRHRQQVIRAPIHDFAEPATIEAAPSSSRPSSSSKSPPSGKGKSKGSAKAAGGKGSRSILSTSKGSKASRVSASSAPVVIAEAEEEAESPSPVDMARSGYFSRSGTTSPVATRASSRTAMRPQTSYYEMPASGYRPGSSGSMRRRVDVSPTRSLPDDPDWVPASRSRSSSQLYRAHGQANDAGGYVGHGGGAAGYSASSGRRIVSEPVQHPAVAYSSLRRNVAGAPGAGRSGLGREYVEGPVEDDAEYDEDSDEGVRVDIQSESYGGYRIASRPGGNARARKER